MNKNYAVEFKNVSKIYKMDKPNEKNEKTVANFYALKNISFEIPKGESVGIFGTNGSGKSTLSKILAGIVLPDEGEIDIVGEQALIAINSGLNNKLTGLENIELKGVLLGFSKERIKEITESVIEFSELGDFIHQPVKKYSSGMKSKLGFSISINIDPDIIIVDEALSVGDKTFNEKCLNKINEMMNKGKTIFYVSHSVGELKKFCDKGLWIEGGILKSYDNIDVVADQYLNYVDEYKKKSKKEQKNHREAIFNNRIVRIEKKQNMLRNRLKISRKKIVALVASIALLGTVSYAGVRIYKSNNKNNIAIDVKDIAILEETQSYVFVTTRKVNENDFLYRDYVKKDMPIIEDIVEVTFDKDGQDISITQIPANLQYYYKSEGVSDELSYYYHVEKDNSRLLDYITEITGIKVKGVYELTNGNIKEAKNIINISENSYDLKDINKLNDSKVNEYISTLTNKGYEIVEDELIKVNKENGSLSKTMKAYINNSKLQNIKTNTKDIEVAETIVSRLLDAYTEITNYDIINNKILYIEGIIDPKTNIFVKRYSELPSLPTMNNNYNTIDNNESNDIETNTNIQGSGSSTGSGSTPGNGSNSGNNNGNTGVVPPSTGGSSDEDDSNLGSGDNSGSTTNPDTGENGSENEGSNPGSGGSSEDNNEGDNSSDENTDGNDSGSQPDSGNESGGNIEVPPVSPKATE